MIKNLLQEYHVASFNVKLSNYVLKRAKYCQQGKLRDVSLFVCCDKLINALGCATNNAKLDHAIFKSQLTHHKVVYVQNNKLRSIKGSL